MTGIGELLLLDERVVVQPIEQLRAVGADHLGLRIMDMGVDESRHDERARMIIDRRAVGSAGENVARFADRLDQPVPDEDRAVLEIVTRGQSGCRGIVGERKDPAADDSRARAHGRMSWSRSAAMRSISASAVRISASGSFSRRRSKLGQDVGFALALDRHDEGEAEAGAIGLVERGELRELVWA